MEGNIPFMHIAKAGRKGRIFPSFMEYIWSKNVWRENSDHPGGIEVFKVFRHFFQVHATQCSVNYAVIVGK